MTLKSLAFSRLPILNLDELHQGDIALMFRAGLLNPKDPQQALGAVRLADIASPKFELKPYEFSFSIDGQSSLQTTIELGQLIVIGNVSINYPARVRLYSSLQDQLIDFARYPATIRPTINNVIDCRFKADLLSVNVPFLTFGTLEPDKRLPVTINLESGNPAITYDVILTLLAVVLNK